MSQIDGEMCIFGPLATFDLDLVDGGQLTILAHGFHEEGGEYVFSVLMKGTPAFEVDVARVPTRLIVSNMPKNEPPSP